MFTKYKNLIKWKYKTQIYTIYKTGSNGLILPLKFKGHFKMNLQVNDYKLEPSADPA